MQTEWNTVQTDPDQTAPSYTVCPDLSVQIIRIITIYSFLSLNHDSFVFIIKILKFRTPKICCNHPKSLTKLIFHRVMHRKDAEGIANSVDSDQTAPLGAV